jgi:4-amino-4-deoxy-L-arabinose transferase-like glycosyltransferase
MSDTNHSLKTNGHRWLRWPLYGALLAGSILLLLNLTPPYSTLLFAVLMVAAVSYAVRSSRQNLGAAIDTELAAAKQQLENLQSALKRAAAWMQAQRAWLSPLFALAAVGLVCWSAYIFRPGNIWEADTALGLVALAVLALGLALKLGSVGAFGVHRVPETSLQSHLASLTIQPEKRPLVPARRRAALVGLIALGLVAAVNAFLQAEALPSAIRWLWFVPSQMQFWLFWVSIGLIAWGLTDLSIGNFVRATNRLLLRHPEIWPLALIMLLAVILRLWNLEYAVHRYVDEVLYMNGVVRLWDEPFAKILVPFHDITAFTWMYPYFQQMTVSVFGQNLTSIRLISVVFGTMTIPALFLLARTLFDRRTALLAALFLATFPPHVHFSRLGLNNIADPFFGTLALAFLARGLLDETSKHGRTNFVLAGVCLGLTQYFYEGGKLLYPPLTIAWLGWLIVFGRAGVGQSGIALNAATRRNLTVFALVALVIAAPVYTTLFAHNHTLTPRLNSMGRQAVDWQNLQDTTGGPLRALWEQIRYPFWFYVQLADTSPWFYGGKTALILGYWVPVFLLGVGHSIWRLRTLAFSLPLIWVVITALGNSLLRDTTEAPRFVVVFPALALLVAVGIRYTVPLIESFWAQWRSRAGLHWLITAAVVLLVIGLAAAQTAYYFGPHLEAFNLLPETHDPDDAMFRAVKLPPNTDVHIIGDAIIWPLNIYTTLRFWERNTDITINVLKPELLDDAYLQGLLLNHNQAFFVAPEDAETVAILRRYFTLGTPEISPYDLLPKYQFVMYYVPRREY